MTAPYTCSHGRSFDPAKESCPACDIAIAAPEPDVLGEGELACAAAAARGLPDGFTVEERMWQAWKFATDRSEKCADLADSLFEASDIDMAVKLEANAAKWADTAIKAAKLGAGAVAIRERIAAADRADRAEAKREEH